MQDILLVVFQIIYYNFLIGSLPAGTLSVYLVSVSNHLQVPEFHMHFSRSVLSTAACF